MSSRSDPVGGSVYILIGPILDGKFLSDVVSIFHTCMISAQPGICAFAPGRSNGMWRDCGEANSYRCVGRLQYRHRQRLGMSD